MSGIFDIGDDVVAAATFVNDAGSIADPTSVVVAYRDPAGVKTDVAGGSIVHDSTGKYHVNISPTLPGEYWVRFAGTGAVVAVEEVSFLVRSSRVL